MRLLGLAVVAFLVVMKAAAQDRLATVLERAAVASDAQKHSLPSFECREEVVSQTLHKDKVEEAGRMVAMLRVHRGPAGRLDESYEPVEGSQGRGALPYYVIGGFGMALEFVARDQQGCYTYALNGDRLAFRAKPHKDVPSCTNPDGVAGWARVDADGDITYIERSVPEKQAERTGFVPWAGVDLGTVSMDGRAFRMSTHVVALSSAGRDHGRFEATYTGCRLFAAEITIRPGTAVETPPPEK